jgi:hypothetical protein
VLALVTAVAFAALGRVRARGTVEVSPEPAEAVAPALA